MVSKTLFHGSNVLFEKFDESKARVIGTSSSGGDYYGGGAGYFTANETVAEGYARSMYKKGLSDKKPNNIEIVYTAQVSIAKLFDVDHDYTGKELTQFYRRTEQEQFARGAGLLTYGVDKYEVLAKLDDGRFVLSGEQVWNGLSGGQNRTIQAREKLKQLGFSTLRYNGGLITGGIKHDVYVAYNPSDIRIQSYKIGKPLNQSGFK